MNENLKTERRKLADLTAADYNPRKALTPEDAEYQKIKHSIKEFGYVDPIIVNEDGTIIGGHQRCTVLQELGYTEVDVVVVSLDKQREKALNIALNKIDGEWDELKLKEAFRSLEISGEDLSLKGFSASEISELRCSFSEKLEKEVENAKNNGVKDESYVEFEEKFKPKLTTDDCFTPPLVYEAAKEWAVNEYGWQGREIVRPFYPGGNYEDLDQYPKNCVVIDNPPFSIFAKIRKFYNEHAIDYFLFGPHLTLFSSGEETSFIPTGVSVVYDNGAVVCTSFVCSKGPRIRTAPGLYQVIEAAVEETLRENGKVDLPDYTYPVNLITSSKLSQWSKYGVEYSEDRVSYTRGLDSQKEKGKGIFGAGFIVPEAKAAEAAKAAKAAKAAVWEFSEREKEIVRQLEGSLGSLE